VRYQLGNHQGSASIETDEKARVISYEEYHPFGTTSYQASDKSINAAYKRYRYTGMERDEESGLEYHGARYYLPWLARWLSADPKGLEAGMNFYAYVKNSPINFFDPTGNDEAQEIMMGMMWDRLGMEMTAMIEGFFGGEAYVNPQANVLEYSPPKNGVGGVVGGTVRAATFRVVPIEDDPSPVSLMGMEIGASLVPVADPAARLFTAETVTHQPASRWVAAGDLALDVVPLAWELKPIRVEARLLTTEVRIASEVADATNTGRHIGAGGGRVGPSVTNPTCRGDLCVADVGSHAANMRLAPGQKPVTNTEFVEAAGRPVSRTEAPITDTGQAVTFLNEGFEGLYRQGRITQPMRATIPREPVPTPGEYLAVMPEAGGGHALHVTISDEVIGSRFLYQNKPVTRSMAAELIENEETVVEQTLYRQSFYDPQKGVCTVPSAKPKSYVRINSSGN
ncbi:MAG TPA: RHS repeat-associated core domain-containing protein, partial [Flavisolibacter sp.]|jgi:RHS repeat-associated protein